MLTITLISLMLGMTLGQRFRVLVLLPAILLILIIALAAASVHLTPSFWILTELVACAIVGLQIGYLFAVSSRHLIAMARTREPTERIPTQGQRLSSTSEKMPGRL